mgnify:CR=1 FL=1
MASPQPDPPAYEIERLASGMGTWLPRMARRARQAVLVVAGFAGLTGVVALVLGLAAWHDPVGEAVVVLVVTLPAVAAPVMTARKLRPLTAAVAQPDETARQARAYFAPDSWAASSAGSGPTRPPSPWSLRSPPPTCGRCGSA